MTDHEPRFVCTGCRAIYRAGFERCPRDGAPLEPLGNDPLVGCLLQDRYLIECCIGEGAMGRVYRARHARMSKRFAVKVLFGDLAADPRMRARFAQEAEGASRMEHPNVVSVIDFGGNDKGLLYLAMDFIEGQNLATLLALEAPFDEVRVIRLARELAKGLAHAHDRGLVHRDFKADNVVVVHDGEREIPKIIDFGVAFLKESGTPNDRLTATGCVVGTPAYMSPEQAAGLDLDHRTDLFSLGLLMYEMLAGRAPFEGSPIEVARLNATVPVPPISERTPGVKVNAALEAVVLRLLEKQPQDRFQTATAVVEALGRIRVDSSVQRPHLTPRNAIPSTPPTVASATAPMEPALFSLPQPRGASPAPRPFAPPIPNVPGVPSATTPRPTPLRSLTESEEIQELDFSASQKRQSRGKLNLFVAAIVVAIGVVLIVQLEKRRRTAQETAPAGIEAQAPAETEKPEAAPARQERKEVATVPREEKRRKRRAASHSEAAEGTTANEPGAEVEAAEPGATVDPGRALESAAPAAEPELSVGLLADRYSAVGATIDRFEASFGREAAAPYMSRYKSLPYQDAITSADTRKQMVRDLDQLASDVKAASQR